MAWSGWNFLGRPNVGIAGGPATVSRNGSVANVYVRGGDNALWQRAWTGSAWSDWTRHNDGGVLISRPAVDSMAPDHEHLFVRGTDNQVWQKWWTQGGGWSGWIPLGAPPGGFIGAPATVSRNATVANIYVRGSDNALWQRAFHDGNWDAWTRHNDGGVLASEVAVGSMGPDHEHLFIVGTDGRIWQKWWTQAGGWSGWIPHGRPPVGVTGSPATISRSATVANVYVRGGDNALWQLAFYDGRWNDWARPDDAGLLSPTGVLTSDPCVGSMGPDHEHVFAVGTDNAVWQKWWTATPRATARFHIKILTPPPSGGLQTMVDSMRAVYGSVGLGVEVASLATLSAPDIPLVTDVNVGLCQGASTSAQNALYARGGANWSGWLSHGAPAAGFLGAPVTISRNSSVANIYVRGGDNALWQKSFFGSRWTAWIRHDDGGVIISRPAVGSMGPDHEHLFARGSDNQVWQKWWTQSGGWSGWIPLGAPPGGFIGAPATVSRNATVANIYVRGSDNALWQRAFHDGNWDAWTRHNDGGVLASDVAVASMAPDHEHLFVIGTNGEVFQKWWTQGGGWSGWISHGRPAPGITGSPVTISRNSSVANIYVRGGDNALWQRAFFNGNWTGWTRHEDDGVLASEPSAGSMGPQHEHVFVRGTDGNVWQKYWFGGNRSGEIVIFFVRSTVPSFNGCATFPASAPGAVVVQGASRWTLAHEIGHVLGLNHLAGENCNTPGYVPSSLMTGCGTSLITVPLPSLSSGEAGTMSGSGLIVQR
jgi:hypothetical protein